MHTRFAARIVYSISKMCAPHVECFAHLTRERSSILTSVAAAYFSSGRSVPTRINPIFWRLRQIVSAFAIVAKYGAYVFCRLLLLYRNTIVYIPAMVLFLPYMYSYMFLYVELRVAFHISSPAFFVADAHVSVSLARSLA